MTATFRGRCRVGQHVMPRYWQPCTAQAEHGATGEWTPSCLERRILDWLLIVGGMVAVVVAALVCALAQIDADDKEGAR